MSVHTYGERTEKENQITLPCVVRVKFATDDSPRVDVLLYAHNDVDALEYMEFIALRETFGREWDPNTKDDPFYDPLMGVPRPVNCVYVEWVQHPGYVDMRVPSGQYAEYERIQHNELANNEEEEDDEDEEERVDRTLDENFLGQIAVWYADESGNRTLVCLYKCVTAHVSVVDMVHMRTAADIALETGDIPQYRECTM